MNRKQRPSNSNYQDILEGAANLLYDVDKKCMVFLRDGRTLIGILRSVDQYANVALQSTVERIYVGKRYGEIERGVMIIRGENVSFLGEFDPAREAEVKLIKVPLNIILEEQQLEQEVKDNKLKRIKSAMKDRGLNYSLPDTSFY